MKTHPFALLLPGFLAVSSLQAGQPAAGAEQSAQEVEDLGKISTEEAVVTYRANVSGHADFTSNAKLSGNHSSGDVLFFPGIQGGLTAKLSKTVTFDFDARIESVLYSRYDERSFAGYGATATLSYRPRADLPRIYIGAEPYRYDSYDTGDRLTQAIGLNVGTDWGFSFNRGQSLFFVGYSFSRYFADPTEDVANTSKAVIGVTHQFSEKLFGQLAYSFQYNAFLNADRQDARNAVIANLTYQFNDHLFGTFGANFIDSDSNQDHASYQSIGSSVGVIWNF